MAYQVGSPMLTVSEVAYLLNLNISTVRRWSNKGILRTYRVGSRGDRRFKQEDIEVFINDRLQGDRKEH